jgi:hypothetical protein
MSEDISPTWIVLLESIFRIIQVLFLIFAMSQESIMVRFSMSVSDHIIVLNYLFLVRSMYSENPNFLVFFIFPSGSSASLANCQLTSALVSKHSSGFPSAAAAAASAVAAASAITAVSATASAAAAASALLPPPAPPLSTALPPSSSSAAPF